MAVVRIKALKNGVRHSATVEGRTYSAVLRCDVESVADGPIAVRDYLANFGLVAGATWRWPLSGAATEIDLASFLQGVDISHDADDGLSYRVVLDYKPIDPAEFGAGGGGLVNWIMAPWTAPPVLKWSSADMDWAITHDREGKPILNSADDPFDPPIVTQLTIPVATITRVEKAFDPDWILVFRNRVNKDPWLGWPAESVLCQDLTGDRIFDPDWGWLWTTTYTLAFKPSRTADNGAVMDAGWDAYVLNAGLRERKNGTLRPIMLGNAPASSPLPLDDDGEYDPNVAIYRRFKIHRTANFDDFNFPTNLFSASTP